MKPNEILSKIKNIVGVELSEEKNRIGRITIGKRNNHCFRRIQKR